MSLSSASIFTGPDLTVVLLDVVVLEMVDVEKTERTGAKLTVAGENPPLATCVSLEPKWRRMQELLLHVLFVTDILPTYTCPLLCYPSAL